MWKWSRNCPLGPRSPKLSVSHRQSPQGPWKGISTKSCTTFFSYHHKISSFCSHNTEFFFFSLKSLGPSLHRYNPGSQTEFMYIFNWTMNYLQNMLWVFIFLLRFIIVLNQFTLELIQMFLKPVNWKEVGISEIVSVLNLSKILGNWNFILTGHCGIWPVVLHFQLAGLMLCSLPFPFLWVMTSPGPMWQLWPITDRSKWHH